LDCDLLKMGACGSQRAIDPGPRLAIESLP